MDAGENVAWDDWAETPKRKIVRLLKFGVKAVPSMRNGSGEVPEDKTETAKHNDCLDDIGPNHGLDASCGGVHGRQSHQDNEGS